MNIKCILGLHKYVILGTQSVKNIAGGFSEVKLMRVVKRCDMCSKVSKTGYDISTNAHLGETLNWQPKFN